MNRLQIELSKYDKRYEFKLQEIRDKFNHGGVKGDHAESTLREFLKIFLPPYNRVGTGEVIDTNGNSSKQVDIIITNDEHPYLNDLSGSELFFLEGVGLAGEVKMSLNTSELKMALENGRRFKKLTAKFPKNTSVQCSKGDIERFVEHRGFFIFAFESSIKLDKIYEEIIKFNHENKVPLAEQIDGIFVLNRGVAYNLVKDGGLSFPHTIDAVEKFGSFFVPVPKEFNENIMFSFIAWVHSVTLKIKYPTSILLNYLYDGANGASK